MEDGLLSLKWNNHKSTFFHILSNLRKRATYTDATIACEGKFFPVHRLVMSTCSDYFCDIFERTTCKCPVIILKDIKYQEIESLLDYMYIGEVDVKQSELAGLIKAAECLRIKGLAVPDDDHPACDSIKKNNYVPDPRGSLKRLRRDSNSSDDPQYYYSSSKNLRSHSPSTSVRSNSASPSPVPSQSVDVDPLSSQTIGLYSDTRHCLSEVSPGHDQESVINKTVNLIKVEDTSDERSNKKSINLRLESQRNTNSSENEEDDKPNIAVPVVNNYQEYSSNQSATGIVKDDGEMSSYNGTELAGPSSVQETSHVMNWNEEDNNSFPHYITNSDGSAQQVCIATMDPEMVAVRMFQGTKVHVQRIPPQFGIDVASQPSKILMLQQDSTSIPQISHNQVTVSKTEVLNTTIASKATRLQVPVRRRKLPLQVSFQQSSQQLQFVDTSSDMQSTSVLTSMQPMDHTTLESLQPMAPYKVEIPVTVPKKEPLSEEVESGDDLLNADHSPDDHGESNNNNFSLPQDLSSRRLHECKYCEYRTRSKVDLSKHVRVHTREKPFKCHVCKYETGDRSNFKRHLNGVHKLSDFEVPPLASGSHPKRPTNSRSSLSDQIQAAEIIPENLSEISREESSEPLSAPPVQSLEVVAMPFPLQCSSNSTVR